MTNNAKRLKKVRNFLGLTQQEMAEKINVEWHKIKNIETEKHKLTPEIANDMENIFSISGWWLLTGKGDMIISQEKAKENKEIIDLFEHLTDDEKRMFKAEMELKILKRNIK
ncbi:MAG: helix-turn-helix domain-containing protein [Arcobacteraceae bacterium]